MSDWANRIQATTIATATRHMEGWTSAELEMITAFIDEPNAELARATGRTLFAIQSIKQAVRAGRTVGSTRVAASDRPYRGWLEGDGDE